MLANWAHYRIAWASSQPCSIRQVQVLRPRTAVEWAGGDRFKSFGWQPDNSRGILDDEKRVLAIPPHLAAVRSGSGELLWLSRPRDGADFLGAGNGRLGSAGRTAVQDEQRSGGSGDARLIVRRRWTNQQAHLVGVPHLLRIGALFGLALSGGAACHGQHEQQNRQPEKRRQAGTDKSQLFFDGHIHSNIPGVLQATAISNRPIVTSTMVANVDGFIAIIRFPLATF